MENTSNINFNDSSIRARFPECKGETAEILQGLNREFADFERLDKAHTLTAKRVQTIQAMLQDATDREVRNKIFAVAAAAFLVSLVAVTVLVGIFSSPIALATAALITGMICPVVTVVKCSDLQDLERALRGDSSFFGSLPWLGMILLTPFLPVILIYDAFTRKSRLEEAHNSLSSDLDNELQEIALNKKSYKNSFIALKTRLEKYRESIEECKKNISPNTPITNVNGFKPESYPNALEYVNGVLQFLDSLPVQEHKSEKVD